VGTECFVVSRGRFVNVKSLLFYFSTNNFAGVTQIFSDFEFVKQPTNSAESLLTYAENQKTFSKVLTYERLHFFRENFGKKTYYNPKMLGVFFIYISLQM